MMRAYEWPDDAEWICIDDSWREVLDQSWHTEKPIYLRTEDGEYKFELRVHAARHAPALWVPKRSAFLKQRPTQTL